jgi:predicted peptidase
MRLHYLTLMLCLSASSLIRAQTGSSTAISSSKGQHYRYQVYVPSDYSASQPWPLILQLHANGLRGSDGTKPAEAILGSRVRIRRDLYATIVVFPQTPDGHFWEELLMQRLAMAELEATEREFRIDPNRVYLVGGWGEGHGAGRCCANSHWITAGSSHALNSESL